MTQPIRIGLTFLACLCLVPPSLGQEQGGRQALAEESVVEDFQNYRSGDSPYTWKRRQGRKLINVPELLTRDRDYFEIVQEDSNRFVRLHVDDESTHIIRLNDRIVDWNLKRQPYLSWEWRALELPTGADERKEETNDSGAAVYVTFSRDLLGRPKSIKYTYSSTLPVETLVRYGRRLVVIVAGSGEGGTGDWQQITRDVAADYRRAFQGSPKSHPLSITLWGDSDNTHSTAVADFDNLKVSSSR